MVCLLVASKLYLILDVLKAVSTETHWRSQNNHMFVNQAAVGAMYVVNLTTKFGWLAEKRTKQCV